MGTARTSANPRRGGYYHPAWPPDGSQIVCGRAGKGRGEVVVMDADGSNLEVRSFADVSAAGNVWLMFDEYLAGFAQAVRDPLALSGIRDRWSTKPETSPGSAAD